jgi:membrane AbrB-like protein
MRCGFDEEKVLGKMIYTLIIACIGGFVGLKLKFPAGALVGSMIFVAIYNIFIGNGEMPANFKAIAQIIVGGLIGLYFTKKSILGLRELIIPAFILTVGMMTSCIILGFLISKLTGLDLITALFSSAPGGLTDMTLISEAYGADISKVALLHLVRMITVIMILPLIIKLFTKYISHY